jgi:hypothetical protein
MRTREVPLGPASSSHLLHVCCHLVLFYATWSYLLCMNISIPLLWLDRLCMLLYGCGVCSSMAEANPDFYFLSWNVRGLNNPVKQEEARQVILMQKPQVVCL